MKLRIIGDHQGYVVQRKTLFKDWHNIVKDHYGDDVTLLHLGTAMNKMNQYKKTYKKRSFLGNVFHVIGELW